MMETLHYVLIFLQLIVILLLLTFSLQVYVDSKERKEQVTEVTKEEYEEWKRENGVK